MHVEMNAIKQRKVLVNTLLQLDLRSAHTFATGTHESTSSFKKCLNPDSFYCSYHHLQHKEILTLHTK